MASPFIWFDLRTRDASSAQDFYNRLLGWPVREVPAGDGAAMTMIGDGDQPWGMVAPLPAAELPAHWLPYVQVEDLDAATSRAEGLGATIVQNKTRGPGGDFSVISDPTGAPFALWQPAEK